MVAVNPLFAGRWTLKKFRATIINDIWPEVLFFTLIATMVALVSKHTSADLGVSNQLLTVLGTVLGLVISFRTSSAYERYSEGRRLWSSIGLASRNVATIIWVHVPLERIDKEDPKKSTPVLEVVIEKKTMVNLVQAFSVSVKHMLRSEPGIYYEDLYPLVCFLPRYAYKANSHDDLLPMWQASMDSTLVNFPLQPRHRRGATMPLPSTNTGHYYDEDVDRSSWYQSYRPRERGTFDPEKVLPIVTSEYPLKPARNPPKFSFFDYMPMLLPLRTLYRFLRRKFPNGGFQILEHDEGPATRTMSGKKGDAAVDSNTPLEVALYLSSYLAWLLKKGLLPPAIATSMTNNIAALQDAVFSLDKIRSTPLPFAYQAHLRLSLWIYLALLPFQGYTAFGYLIIPATTFASFLLVGFLEIGQQIENPFNYDANDLDLDHFCLTIQRELHEITAHSSLSPDGFIYTSWNQPFAPGDRRTAKEIVSDKDHEYHEADAGMDSIRRTLLHNWRDVNGETRPR